MTDNNEEILRRSLDAVDRHRNRLIIAIVIVFLPLVYAFAQATTAIHSGNMTLFLHSVMLILGVWTSIMTLAVIIQITMMTKRILRAIELAARK